jgi:transketolase
MSMMPQREAYGRALVDYGDLNKNIVVLDADTSSSTLTNFFAARFPERFYNVGIAEPSMVDFGVGLSLGGFIPFVNAFAAFLALRAIEQIRTCVAYANTNVKLVGHYAGLSDYKDGPTHNCIIDVAVIRAIPNLTVIVPSDNNQIKNWIPVIAAHQGPLYFRISRDVSLPVHPETIQPQIGKAIQLREGSDVTLIANGTMVGRTIIAADQLHQQGILARILELHTLKPLDVEAICLAANKTGAIVTVEEHSIIGGLGGAVAEALAENCPTPIVRVGVKDCFAYTALDAESLMDHMGLSIENIVAAAKAALKKK